MPEKDPPGYTDPIPVFTNEKMRLWRGEVTCPRSQSELVTEWRRCPKSPDSRLLRKLLQNKLAGKITSERQQSHWSLREPLLPEKP